MFIIFIYVVIKNDMQTVLLKYKIGNIYKATGKA